MQERRRGVRDVWWAVMAGITFLFGRAVGRLDVLSVVTVLDPDPADPDGVAIFPESRTDPDAAWLN